MAFVDDLLLRAGIELTGFDKDVAQLQLKIASIPKTLASSTAKFELVPNAAQQGQQTAAKFVQGFATGVEANKAKVADVLSIKQAVADDSAAAIAEIQAATAKLQDDAATRAIQGMRREVELLGASAKQLNLTPQARNVEGWASAIAASNAVGREAVAVDQQLTAAMDQEAQATQRAAAATLSLAEQQRAQDRVLRQFLATKKGQNALELANIAATQEASRGAAVASALMSGSFTRMGAASRSAGVGIASIRGPLATLTAQLTATNPTIAQLSSVLGTLAIGSTAMLGALAGLAALAAAYRLLTKDAREAAKEQLEVVERTKEFSRQQAIKESGGQVGFDIGTNARQIDDLNRRIAETQQLLEKLRPAAGLLLFGSIVQGLQGHLGNLNRTLRETEITQSLLRSQERVENEGVTRDTEEIIRNAGQRLRLAALEGTAQERIRIELEAGNKIQEAHLLLSGDLLDKRIQAIGLERQFNLQALAVENSLRRQHAQLERNLEARRLSLEGREAEAEQVRLAISNEQELREARDRGESQVAQLALVEVQRAEAARALESAERAINRALGDLGIRFLTASTDSNDLVQATTRAIAAQREYADAILAGRDAAFLAALAETQRAEATRAALESARQRQRGLEDLELRRVGVSDVSVRDAAALRLEIEQRREYEDAVRSGKDALYLSTLAEVQRAEKLRSLSGFTILEKRFSEDEIKVIDDLAGTISDLSIAAGDAVRAVFAVIQAFEQIDRAKGLGLTPNGTGFSTPTLGDLGVLGGFLSITATIANIAKSILDGAAANRRAAREFERSMQEWEIAIRGTSASNRAFLEARREFEQRVPFFNVPGETPQEFSRNAERQLESLRGVIKPEIWERANRALELFKEQIEVSTAAIRLFANTLEGAKLERETRDRLAGIERDPMQQISADLNDLFAQFPDTFNRIFAGIDLTNKEAIREAALRAFDTASNLQGPALEAFLGKLAPDEFVQFINSLADHFGELDKATQSLTGRLFNVPEIFNFTLASLRAAGTREFPRAEPLLPGFNGPNQPTATVDDHSITIEGVTIQTTITADWAAEVSESIVEAIGIAMGNAGLTLNTQTVDAMLRAIKARATALAQAKGQESKDWARGVPV